MISNSPVGARPLSANSVAAGRAFSYVGGARNSNTSSTASVTHGLTISKGDLVVAYINRNDSIAISNDAGGSAWTEAMQETPPTGETCSHALFWKIAGVSEPATYTWSLNGSDSHQVLLKVFSSARDAVVDAAAATSVTTVNSSLLTISAIDGQIISDNAVSLVFGGKDRDSSAGLWGSATDSYTDEIGNLEGRYTGGAHRIYTAGQTFSGDVTMQAAGGSSYDKTYSVHISFVESSAPSSVTGAISKTLDDASSSTSGIVTNKGSLSETLEAATSSASGSVGAAPSGTINVTLADATSAANGSVINNGSISETLEGASSAASGMLTVSGALSESLQDAISAASGAITIIGALSEQLEDASITAAGVLVVSGSISEQLESTTASASGVIGDVVAGYIGATLDNTSSSASGVVPYTGTVSETLENATSTASGSVQLNVDGTITETLDSATATASGSVLVNITGTLAEILEDIAINGSGSVEVDYVTPKHNMTLTVENRIMTLTIENRIMRAD